MLVTGALTSIITEYYKTVLRWHKTIFTNMLRYGIRSWDGTFLPILRWLAGAGPGDCRTGDGYNVWRN